MPCLQLGNVMTNLSFKLKLRFVITFPNCRQGIFVIEMVLTLFDYIDTTCSDLLQNQEMRDQTSVKDKLISHKLAPE